MCLVRLSFTVRTSPSSFSGESEVRNEHPVLENHGHPGGREDGQTCAAQEHPDRG